MQITERDQKLLIILACVLLLAGAYQFGYRNYGDKRAAIQEEIEALQTRYDDLSSKEIHREAYLTETKENKSKIEELLSHYPSELGTDNEIFFTKLLEDSTGLKIVQMSYTEPDSFYLGSEQEVVNEMQGNLSTSTISIESDYSQFKKMLSYIGENQSRKVIQNINLSYDSKTGILSGTVAYNNYSLVGTDTVYEPYTISTGTTGQGVSNLFGELAKK